MNRNKSRKKHFKVWVEGKDHPLLITATNEAKARYLVKENYPGTIVKKIVWSPGNNIDFSHLLGN